MGMNDIELDFGATQSSWIKFTPIRTINTINRAQGHNTRSNKAEINRAGHIKSDLTAKNEYLVGSDKDDFYRMAVEDITGHAYVDEEWIDAKDSLRKDDLRYMFGGKVQKNAILLAEVEARYPGEIHLGEDGGWEANDAKDFQKWKDETMKFMEEHFHKENIKNAVIHMDEGRPHIHVIFTPVYTNDKGERRLNYSKFVNGPNDIRNMKKEYADRIGYEPGVIMSTVKQIPRKEIERTMQLAVSEHLPEPKEGQTAKEYRDEIAEPQFEACNLKRADAELKAKRYINTHKEAQAKDKVIDKQREMNADLQRRIQIVQEDMKRARLQEEAERIGASLHPDQDMINDIYYPLKDKLIQIGLDHIAQIEELEDQVKEQEEKEQREQDYPKQKLRDEIGLD